ncbi:MAG: DUF1810 domain-containing protein [Acetobacterium sp.]
MDGIERFIKAQEHNYEIALQEIKNGHKRSQWMWYIFPQIKGLGHSSATEYYAIKNRTEAKVYMAHPVLGSRLLEITGELLKLETSDAEGVFDWPDDMKLKSSMTLFYIVSNNQVFKQVLDKFFGGEFDDFTVDQLAQMRL